MTIIENIRENIIKEHINWHSKPGDVSAGGRAIDPWSNGSLTPTIGSGEEFLVWHKGFLERFYKWFKSNKNKIGIREIDIKAWQSIPQGLKMGMVGWNARLAADERRLSNISSFKTLDELGRFLEWGLHGWLHVASANMWNEPVLTSFESPRSTLFWQLHGLIDYWRQLWVDNRKELFERGIIETNNQPLRRRPKQLDSQEDFRALRKVQIFSNNFQKQNVRKKIKQELALLDEEWKLIFKDIEEQVIPIPDGEYFFALSKTFAELNGDYNHAFNVQALNLGLRDYMRPGNFLKESDFDDSYTVLELRYILEDYYIL